MRRAVLRAGGLIALTVWMSGMSEIGAEPRAEGDAMPQAPVAAAASIAGRVVTAGETPQPVRRAVVTLLGGTLTHSVSAITNDEGAFFFGPLPEGRFTLTASRPGFITAAYGAKQPGRPGTSIILRADDALRDVTLRLGRGAVISGVIRDETGEPLANSLVAIARMDSSAASAATPTTLVTDDQGMYRAYGLPPGRYLVASTVRANGVSDEIRGLSAAAVDTALQDLQRRTGRVGMPGNAPPAARGNVATQAPPSALAQVYAPIFFPGTSDPAAATPVVVAAGEERDGIDIVMRSVPSSTIEGVIVHPGGDPSSALLSVTPEVTLGSPYLTGAQAALTLSPGPDGRFKYMGFLPGRYTIAARTNTGVVRTINPSGTVSVTSGPPATGAGAPPTLWAAADVRVEGGETLNLTLTLQPPLRLVGRIVFEGTTVAPPKDLATVRVNMSQSGSTLGTSLSANGMFGRLPTPPSQVRPDGTFEFIGVLPGRYQLGASVPGEPRWWLRSVVVGGRDVLDAGLDVTPSSDLSAAVITFTDRRTELSGTLQTPAGLPAPDYYIVVISADRAYWRPQSRRLAMTRPGNDGRFVIRDLPPGDYWLAALTDFDPDEWRAQAFLDQVVAGALRLSLAEGETKTQDLRIAQ